MLKKGMKIKLIKPFEILGVTVGTVGQVYAITEIIGDNMIFFESETGNGTVTMNNFNEHFEVYVEPEKDKAVAPTVTKEQIDEIMKNAEITANTVHDKCTVVSVKLPNGFVITESSACVSAENYDKDMGVDICMNKIINKVWELEGYRLQCELYEANEAECECEECCCNDCDEMRMDTI